LRGKDVVIIQSTCHPVNDNLVELLLMITTAKRQGAATVTCVIPYFGYCRQDRKTQPGTPISASDVASWIEASGANRIITVDLHAGQISGFFSSKTACESIDS